MKWILAAVGIAVVSWIAAPFAVAAWLATAVAGGILLLEGDNLLPRWVWGSKGADVCSCGGPLSDNWFDRSICPTPCDTMHTRCTNCGAALEGCPLETE